MQRAGLYDQSDPFMLGYVDHRSLFLAFCYHLFVTGPFYLTLVIRFNSSAERVNQDPTTEQNRTERREQDDQERYGKEWNAQKRSSRYLEEDIWRHVNEIHFNAILPLKSSRKRISKIKKKITTTNLRFIKIERDSLFAILVEQRRRGYCYNLWLMCHCLFKDQIRDVFPLSPSHPIMRWQRFSLKYLLQHQI